MQSNLSRKFLPVSYRPRVDRFFNLKKRRRIKTRLFSIARFHNRFIPLYIIKIWKRNNKKSIIICGEKKKKSLSPTDLGPKNL